MMQEQKTESSREIITVEKKKLLAELHSIYTLLEPESEEGLKMQDLQKSLEEQSGLACKTPKWRF
jgi:hypothetical protein